MKCYTWCNIVDHPKLAVLEKSAKAFNIHITVLGKGIKWERNFLKVGLLLEAIKDLNADELILCTDAFDVLYLQDAQTIIDRYHAICASASTNSSGAESKEAKQSEPIVFSAERLYSHHYPKYKAFWDAIPAPFGYRYLNSGTFIGYQKNLVAMLKQILKDAHNYTEKSDQKLYAEYAVKNPGKIILDYRCELFWCPAGEQEILQNLYKVESDKQGCTLKNLKTKQNPCLIHITHSKGFYDLLLKVALEMGFINSGQRDKYWKLHKKDIASSPKKKPLAIQMPDKKESDKSKPKHKPSTEKAKGKTGPGTEQLYNNLSTNKQKAVPLTHMQRVIKDRRAINALKRKAKTKLRHHLVSNGRVIGECTTCYSGVKPTSSKPPKRQNRHNTERFPSYI